MKKGKKGREAYTCSTRSRARAHVQGHRRSRSTRLYARALDSLKHAAWRARVRPSTRTYATKHARESPTWWGEGRWMGIGARHGPMVGRTAHVLHPLPSSAHRRSQLPSTWAHISSRTPFTPPPVESLLLLLYTLPAPHPTSPVSSSSSSVSSSSSLSIPFLSRAHISLSQISGPAFLSPGNCSNFDPRVHRWGLDPYACASVSHAGRKLLQV